MSANFLVIQLARLGDLLQTKRLILSLQKQGQVTLLVDNSLKAFACLIYPDVDVVSLPAHGFNSLENVLVESKKTFAFLKSTRFTRVYNLNYSPLNFVCSRIFPSPVVEGYGHFQGQYFKSSWMQKGFLWTRNRKLAPLNLVDFWAYLTSPLPPEEVNPPALWKNAPIGIALSGRNARRSLSARQLASLIKAFLRQNKEEFWLFGTKKEVVIAKEILSYLSLGEQERVEDLTGQTSLTDLVDVFSGLGLFITPDTGLMHLACHVGVKTLCFFLASAWCFETGPYGQGHEIYQTVLDCSPCLENKKCFAGLACKKIFSDELFVKLAKREVDFPPELAKITSCFDELGVEYESKRKFSFLEKRKLLRQALKEYLLGIDLGIAYPEFIFQDREWILDWEIDHVN
ncbi:MAG: glycosyltransferase family 9 protein [Desulfonauticus sp.]|nr:glycosyltransferase family 9 protein [Desulfonauticus sp.]